MTARAPATGPAFRHLALMMVRGGRLKCRPAGPAARRKGGNMDTAAGGEGIAILGIPSLLRGADEQRGE